MGVYIPKREMPHNCDICFIGDCPYDAHFDSYRMMGGKPNDCPLVEVKSHGRLIDADVLSQMFDSDESFGAAMLDIIADTPTIIEAEKEDANT